MWHKYKAIIVIVIVLAGTYGLRMLYRYIRVEDDLDRRSSAVIHPSMDDGSVSQVGYIYSMRNELFLNDDNTINLVWFIKIPATGERFSCSWERGFSGFKKGDDVRLIRPKDVTAESGYGYIVGLHDTLQGKTSLVNVNDEESLELETGP